MMIEETPVRLPAQIRKDAFFYKAANRAVANGSRRTDAFALPPSPHGSWSNRTFWTAIGVTAVTILLAILGSEIWLLSASVGLVAVIGLSVMDDHNRNQKVMQKFRKEGHLVQGEIISCIASTHNFSWRYSAGAFVVQIEYRFKSPDGGIFRSSIKEPRPDFNGKQLPAPGTPVYVLYFNEQESYLL